MIAACEQAGVKLLVGHVVRYFPQYAQAKALVERGEVGDVAVVRLTRASAKPQRPHDNWFEDTEKSGGMILDLMLHDFDYARWVAGEVESVFCKSARATRPDAPGDYAIAILRHTSGAISNLESAWAYPPPLFRTSLQIAGSRGLIDHPAEHDPGSRNADAGWRPYANGGGAVSPLLEDPYTLQLKEFYDVLVHDATPRVTAHDALMALRLAFAAIRSAETGGRFPAGGMTMRLGIMSFAHLHAEGYIRNLRANPEVEMIGFADDNLERGRHFAQKFNARLFDSYEALIAEKPDGVVICTENACHRPVVEMAAEAGVHVLSEKPLATTLEDARAMLDVCERNNVWLMTAFPMRFNAPILEVKRVLDSGALGRLYGINTTNQGKLPRYHTDYVREWFEQKDLAGGGAAMDHIVHLADLLRWYLGQEVSRSHAQITRSYRRWARGRDGRAGHADVEDGILPASTVAGASAELSHLGRAAMDWSAKTACRRWTPSPTAGIRRAAKVGRLGIGRTSMVTSLSPQSANRRPRSRATRV